VKLQGVDGLGELPGAPGTAAELAEDPPVLELGVRALAGERSCAWARLAIVWDSGLFFLLYGTFAYALPW
jgi:hypothetical protein